MPSVEELEQALAEARRQEELVKLPSSTPAEPRAEEASPYAPTTWGVTEYDFTTPSGQLCRLKKLDVAELAEAGILDRVSRLPGVAAGLVAVAEGHPPAKEEETLDTGTLKTVIEVVNILVPLVVVAPSIEPLPEEGEPRYPSLIYVDSIEIADRIAIMNRALGGLAKLDSFRKQS